MIFEMPESSCFVILRATVLIEFNLSHNLWFVSRNNFGLEKIFCSLFWVSGIGEEGCKDLENRCNEEYE